MANYSERGYDIFIPMTNGSRADFVAIKGDEILRVQVKTAQTRVYQAKDTQYTLGVLTTTRNGVVAPYSPEEVDTFFVLGDNKAWTIPNEEVYPRKTVMLESTADDYSPRHGLDVDSWRIAI